MDISAITGSETNTSAYLEKLLMQQTAQTKTTGTTGEEQQKAEETVTGSAVPKYDTLVLDNDTQNTVNNGEMADAVSKATVSLQTSAEETISSAEGNSSKYDTVELSADAQNYADSQTQAAQSGEKPAGKPAGAPPAQASTTEETDTDTTSDLSSYTDEQLKEMLNDDEITQQEYNTEIAKRQSQEQQQKMLEKQAETVKKETPSASAKEDSSEKKETSVDHPEEAMLGE